MSMVIFSHVRPDLSQNPLICSNQQTIIFRERERAMDDMRPWNLWQTFRFWMQAFTRRCKFSILVDPWRGQHASAVVIVEKTCGRLFFSGNTIIFFTGSNHWSAVVENILRNTLFRWVSALVCPLHKGWPVKLAFDLREFVLSKEVMK